MHDDKGSLAITLAVVVGVLLLVTVTAVVQIASTSQVSETAHLGQTQAIDSAEAGLDAGYALIQQANPNNPGTLPCGSNAATGNFGSSPISASYNTSITYYATFPPSGNPLSCTSVDNGSAVPAAAELMATGSALGVKQFMEALVKVTIAQQQGNIFDQAVFSQGNITFANNGTVGQSGQNNANIYTNGAFDCSNSEKLYGSIVTFGADASGYGFAGSGTCTVYGNVTTVYSDLLVNSTTVQGSVTSTSGSVSLSGGTNCPGSCMVGQNIAAYGTISFAYGSCSTWAGGTCTQDDTSLPPPTAETFPKLQEPIDASELQAWYNAGFTEQINDGSNCSQAQTDIANMSSATAPTLITTTCALSWRNSHTITLNNDLAVFALCGFSMQNQTIWQSTSSAASMNNGLGPSLYLLVPTSGVANTTCASGGGYGAPDPNNLDPAKNPDGSGDVFCSSGSSSGSPGITLSNQTQFDSTGTSTPIQVMLYTPCTLNMANLSTMDGQVYGGTVTFTNHFQINFTPVPTPSLASGGGQYNGPKTITVGISYERQTTSPNFQ